MTGLEPKGHIDVSPIMFAGANFAIKITGDVITKFTQGINEGDIAILKTEQVKEGEICVVFFESKTYFLPYEKGIKGKVLGKVLGIIRVY